MFHGGMLSLLVLRALRYSHSWEAFNSEIKRLKQIFVNNNYPMYLIDKLISKALDKFLSNNSNGQQSNNDNDIHYYIQLQNLITFNHDSKRLKNIINNHISSNDPVNKININCYYKSLKLSSVFSTRSKRPDAERVDVVYQFICPRDSCQATYVGYTTNTLSTRAQQHRYRQSNIHSHFHFDHKIPPPPLNNFVNNFKILHSFSNIIDLKIAEALEIKDRKPYINVKYNESGSLLKLFK